MADLFDRVLLLKQSSIFSKVSTDDLRYIAQALAEDVFFAGERVFDINDEGRITAFESSPIAVAQAEIPAE